MTGYVQPHSETCRAGLELYTLVEQSAHPQPNIHTWPATNLKLILLDKTVVYTVFLHARAMDETN